MKVALLSDIHGNLTALEAVLENLRRYGTMDRVICLGDVVVSGPQPRATVRRLMQLRFPTVLGNTDDIQEGSDVPQDEEERMEQEIDAWSLSQLSDEERAYLRTFKPTIESRIGRSALLCYHGSPRSYSEEILPTTSDAELGAMLGSQTADIFAGGHTHNQMFRRFKDKIVLNPGSVGRPVQILSENRVRNPAWAEYAIVETDESASRGTTSVRLLRVGIDSDGVRREILDSGMPHARWRVKDMD